MSNTETAAETDAGGRTKPIHVDTREELDEVIASHDRVLVDIYRKGCSLCQAIEPVLGNVARVTDVTVALYNPENDVETIEEWNVRSVPTLLLFEEREATESSRGAGETGGKEIVDRMAEGFQGTESIVEFVEQ